MAEVHLRSDDDPDSTRSRIIDAAARLTVADGWSKVTMSRLAHEAGVSRQTVYNAVGSREALAEAMVLKESAKFVLEIVDGFDSHPDDLLRAIHNAVEYPLAFAKGNSLLRAVISATHGADTELLPLLTAHSASLLGTVKTVIHDKAERYEIDLTPDQISIMIDLIVRSSMSHVMQPSGTPQETASAIAWLVARVLGRTDELPTTDS